MVQCQSALDPAFAALSSATRRAILMRLSQSDASLGELALGFEMTLTGLKKHVQVLEDAGLVTTEKTGRVRHCRLGPRHLDEESAWIAHYKTMLEARLDRLEAFLDSSR